MRQPKHRFAKAIDSQFTHLGLPATYYASLAPPQALLVIPRRPEQLLALGEGHLHAENPQLEFRVADIPQPLRGDVIQLGARRYRIADEPHVDLHQLLWIADCLPLTP